MTWAALVPLIVQYGLPLAEKIWQKWSSGAAPTQTDWDELKKLSQQTPLSQMKDALTRAGIPLDSPKALELIKLVGG